MLDLSITSYYTLHICDVCGDVDDDKHDYVISFLLVIMKTRILEKNVKVFWLQQYRYTHYRLLYKFCGGMMWWQTLYYAKKDEVKQECSVIRMIILYKKITAF